MKKALATLAMVVALAGCYNARIQLKPTPPTGYGPLHFHFGAIGILELSPPIDLAQQCGGDPNAVVEIWDHAGFLASVVNMVLNYFIPVFYIWNAQVGCAGGGGPPPPGGMMPPPPPGGDQPPPPPP